MKRLLQRLTGKPKRATTKARWFTASLLEANMGAGKLAYGW